MVGWRIVFDALVEVEVDAGQLFRTVCSRVGRSSGTQASQGSAGTCCGSLRQSKVQSIQLTVFATLSTTARPINCMPDTRLAVALNLKPQHCHP